MAFVLHIFDLHFVLFYQSFCNALLIFRIVYQFFTYPHGEKSAYQYTYDCSRDCYFQNIKQSDIESGQ